MKIKPRLDHMNILFMHMQLPLNNDAKGDKFEARGRKGVFLGYPYGTKGYRIFDPEENKMVISRHVRFIEDIFPFSFNNGRDEQLPSDVTAHLEQAQECEDWLKGGVMPNNDELHVHEQNVHMNEDNQITK